MKLVVGKFLDREKEMEMTYKEAKEYLDGVNRIFERTMAPEMKAAMKRADEALIEMINKTENEGK